MKQTVKNFFEEILNFYAPVFLHQTNRVVIHKLVISFSKYITSPVNIKKKRIYHKTIMCYCPKSNTSYISKGYALLFKNGISFYFYMLHYFISNVM